MTWADATTITRPPPGQCFQEGPPSTPPACSSTGTESCCTRVFSNPSSNSLTVDFKRTVRVTSVTMWNDPAGALSRMPVYQTPSQMTGFDLRTGDVVGSTGCDMDPAAVPPAGKAGYMGWTLMCDTGSTLQLSAPGLATSTQQQSSTLLVKICIASTVLGPRNVSLYIQNQ